MKPIDKIAWLMVLVPLTAAGGCVFGGIVWQILGDLLKDGSLLDWCVLGGLVSFFVGGVIVTIRGM